MSSISISTNLRQKGLYYSHSKGSSNWFGCNSFKMLFPWQRVSIIRNQQSLS